MASRLTAPFRFVGRGVKAAFSMVWPRGSGGRWWNVLVPRTSFDYAKEIGDGSRSNIVIAVVNWIARTFPEAPVIVTEERPDGIRERVLGHRMVERIERPNPYYSGVLLWTATVADWALTGNAYWLLQETRRPGDFEIWWAPSWTITPRWPADRNDVFISHYEYRPDAAGPAVEVPLDRIVHFRNGLDPENPRLGKSQLRSLVREIFTDEEASQFTAALMRNLGVPGVIIAPDASVKVDEQTAEEIKEKFMERFGGDRRGAPMVMTAPTKVQMISFSPEQLLLKELRRIPEERVSAVFGVAAVVVGLGAGLDRSTFTNFHEAREAAYENNIIPTQRLFAADLETQLLPRFDRTPNRHVEFDLSRVRVLQPDMDALVERYNRMVLGGWAMVSDARRAVGLPVRPEDDIWLRPLAMAVVPANRGGKAGGQAELKGAEDNYRQEMEAWRRRLAEQFEPAIRAFFAGQARRVQERLVGARLARENGERKQWTVAALLPVAEDELLVEVLTPLWLQAAQAGWEISARAFGLAAAFDAGSREVRDILRDGAFRAGRINDGTRAALAEALEIAQQRGYTVAQLVGGVPADGFRGLVDVVEEKYRERAQSIATTEATFGTNRGATALYRTRGIPRVQMIDMGTDPPCVARNGQIVSVQAGEAEISSEHPHGTLMLVPVAGTV